MPPRVSPFVRSFALCFRHHRRATSSDKDSTNSISRYTPPRQNRVINSVPPKVTFYFGCWSVVPEHAPLMGSCKPLTSFSFTSSSVFSSSNDRSPSPSSPSLTCQRLQRHQRTSPRRSTRTTRLPKPRPSSPSTVPPYGKTRSTQSHTPDNPAFASHWAQAGTICRSLAFTRVQLHRRVEAAPSSRLPQFMFHPLCLLTPLFEEDMIKGKCAPT